MAAGRKRFHLRRKDKEITDSREIERVIRDGSICHLAMVDDGEPYVVPVTFGYDGRALYFHSALEGRKVETLKKDPRVCFNIVAAAQVVERPPDCTTTYRSVTGYGKARPLTGVEEKIAGIKVLMRHSLGYEVDYPANSLARAVVFRIDIDELRGKQSA